MSAESDTASELTALIRDLAAASSGAPVHDETRTQVAELGLYGIGLPEERGGSGGTLADLVVAIRELGRGGLVTPIVEASGAAYAIGGAAAGGFDTVVVAPVDVSASPLSVDLGPVPFAPEASRVVVVGTKGVIACALDDPGVNVEPEPDIAGLPAGRVQLTGVATTALDVAPDDVLERLAVARSAALLGTALGAYELTVQHLREREQFGAALSSIPAVSSALAQMAVQLQQAQSALSHAVTVCAAPADATPLRRMSAACSARIVAASTATTVARTAHQLHGAMGVTKEYPLHRFSTTLWAWRDSDLPETAWAARLGAASLAHGEAALWEQLTV